MSDLAKLRHTVKMMGVLLDQPDPGGRIWLNEYQQRSRDLLEFYGVNVKKLGEETILQYDRDTVRVAMQKEEDEAQGSNRFVRSLIGDCCPDCGSLSPAIHYTPRDQNSGLCENIWHRRRVVEGSQSCG